ncbi:MAG: F0F1 ATP synthase subunit B [Rhodobiaceae bacterium]|nr:F0F1 ATP synthase subunit B [Rhodobiaceae bacterium]MCC0054827.1 F0F1 ATP synthase subunit B [Rhodobiaceae bacterium]
MATEAAHGVGEAAHGASAAFPPFDPSTFASQIFWLVISFALFYYLMSKVALPRLAQILEGRQDRIATDLAEAERLKAETDEAIAAYEQALAEARERAGSIARTTRETVNAEIEAERHAAEKDLSAKLADADGRIASIRDKAMADVSSVAAEAAVAAVQAVAGIKITKGEAEKAVAAA